MARKIGDKSCQSNFDKLHSPLGLLQSVNNIIQDSFNIRKYHMNDKLQIAFSFECFHLGNFLLGLLKAIKRFSQLLW